MITKEEAYSEFDLILRTFENLLKKEFNEVPEKRIFQLTEEKDSTQIPEQKVLEIENQKHTVETTPEDPRLFMTLSELENEAFKCERCNLCKNRTSFFFGEGTLNNPDVFVLLGKSDSLVFEEEDNKMLDIWLSHISLFRNKNLYVCTVLKCRSEKYYNSNIDNINSLDNIKECTFYLKQQILLTKPSFILCVGMDAYNSLSGKNYEEEDESKYGKILIQDKMPTMIIYHPRNVRNKSQLKIPVWEYLKKIASFLKLEIIGKTK